MVQRNDVVVLTGTSYEVSDAGIRAQGPIGLVKNVNSKTGIAKVSWTQKKIKYSRSHSADALEVIPLTELASSEPEDTEESSSEEVVVCSSTGATSEEGDKNSLEESSIDGSSA